MDNVIELKNISKIYGEKIKTTALSDVNLSFTKGTFNSIIGQSGSGKSTLLNIMSTLDTPTEGQILINGTDTSKFKHNKLAELRNETLGFIFQFHYLIPEFTAYENILIPYKIGGRKVTKEIENRVNELLEIVGLTEVKDNLAINMSGGQQQRVAIARSLINNPKIVFADEPTGNLDSKTTEKIYDLLREINEKYGTTFIIVTHNRDVAEKTDRIIEITDGKIHMDISNK